MLSARRTTPLVSLTPLLAVCLPALAMAQSVSVHRGSEVSVVDVGEDDVWAKQNVWENVPAAPQPGGGDPSRSAAPAETPHPPAASVEIVVVDVEASPETAWALVSPWEKSGIEYHEGVGDPSRIVHHSGPTAPEASEMRYHGNFGDPSNPSAIPTLPMGGDESRIRVHEMGSRGPSRIRYHGVER